MSSLKHALLILLGLGFLNFSEAWYVTAIGCVTCYGEPMKYVKVNLMDKDLIIHDTMATTRTNSRGCFSMTGKGKDVFNDKPEPFIDVEYTYSGSYGNMEVGANRGGESNAKAYSRTINFGTLNFRSIHCKSYVRFYDAMKDFRKRTGLSLPYSKLRVRTNVLLHGGTPYAKRDHVYIPKNYAVSKLTPIVARHELAHTFRHSYDGSLLHFLNDVARFWYLRVHTCATKSNHGYAFNEGWAEFWAGECYGTFGSDSTDYEIEGNVAEALRKLKSDCSASDYKMVNVLKSNPEKIHSFSSYKSKYIAKYGC